MPEITNSNSLKPRGLFILACLALLPWQASTQSWADSELERLLDSGQYPVALKLLGSRLESVNTLSPRELMYYHTRLSQVNHKYGDFATAKSNALKALSFSNEVGDSALVAEAKLAILFTSTLLSEDRELIPEVETIRSFAERTDNAALLRTCHSLIGSTLVTGGFIEEGRKHIRTALGISTSHPLPRYRMADETALGLVLLFSNPDSARVHMLNGMRFATAQGDSLSMAAACMSYSYYLRAVNDVENWKEKTQECIGLCSAAKHFHFVTHGISLLAQYEMSRGNHSKAIEYGKRARQLLKAAGKSPMMESFIDSLLYRSSQATGNHKEALAFLESYAENTRLVFSEKQSSAVAELAVYHNLREKNLLIQNQELSLVNSRRQRLLLLALNIMLAGLVIFLLLLKWLRRNHAASLYKKEKRAEALAQELRTRKNEPPAPSILDISIPEEGDPANQGRQVELIPEERKDLYDEMMALIETRRLFLNPKLDQKLLVSMLGTNRNYLFQAINHHAEANFRNIVNGYRIAEAKRIIEEHCGKSNKTDFPEAIHELAGFNSERTFHRAFKNATGLTAREYAREYLSELNAAKK